MERRIQQGERQAGCTTSSNFAKNQQLLAFTLCVTFLCVTCYSARTAAGRGQKAPRCSLLPLRVRRTPHGYLSNSSSEILPSLLMYPTYRLMQSHCTTSALDLASTTQLRPCCACLSQKLPCLCKFWPFIRAVFSAGTTLENLPTRSFDSQSLLSP